MYLFIFESIGTSELILIGLVALIIFGPRNLPEMMRTFGKAMADFKRTTNEFKDSWEREVDFENITKETPKDKPLLSDTIERTENSPQKPIDQPEIKEISADEFGKISVQKPSEEAEFQIPEKKEIDQEKPSEIAGKSDWL